MPAQPTEDFENSKQTRRSFLKTSAGALGGLAMAMGPGSLETLATPGASPGRKPNFVFFLGEGVRNDSFSFMGNPIVQTPVQDRLAKESMVFQNAFVTNALSVPSRSSFLTGLYSHTHGNVDNQVKPIPQDIPLISDLLRQAGYEVALFGRANIDVEDRYWDYYFGFKGWVKYYHPLMRECVAGKWSDPKIVDGYVDDLVTDRALQWLEQKHEKPFCAFIWFNAPHAPFYRPRRLLDLYNGVKIPKPETFDDDLKDPPYPGKTSAIRLAYNKIGTDNLGDDDPRTLEEVAKDYYAGIVDNDQNIGRVLQSLDKTNRTDDTAVILTSDHGFFLGEWRMYDKRFMYEPSIRVPLMVRYPALIKPGICNATALNVDIAPTLLELAGVRVPASIQGRSLVPLLTGEPPDDWRTDWLYEYFEFPAAEHVRPHRGIRNERYKLIHFHAVHGFPDLADEFELYDLQQDPGELQNLYGRPEYASLTRQLLERLAQLRKETGDRTTDATT
jgi:arylsulfatase A-like enzyme